MSAFVPVAVGFDVDFGALVGEIAVLLAAAVVMFLQAGTECLGCRGLGDLEGF